MEQWRKNSLREISDIFFFSKKQLMRPAFSPLSAKSRRSRAPFSRVAHLRHQVVGIEATYRAYHPRYWSYTPKSTRGKLLNTCSGVRIDGIDEEEEEDRPIGLLMQENS